MTAAQRPPVVLLCGGLGLRQRTDTDDLPKALRQLPDGQPLLLHILQYYRSFGCTEFVLCVGYRAEAIREVVRRAHPAGGELRITFVDSGTEAGKCVRLLDARPHVGRRRFLLGYSDVLSSLDLDDLIRTHQAGRGLLTLVATRVRSRYGVVRLGERTLVTAFDEKPVDDTLISAGYFVCEPELFAELSPEASFERDVLPRLAARRELHGFRHDGMWVALDTYKDFLDVESLVQREGQAWLTRV